MSAAYPDAATLEALLAQPIVSKPKPRRDSIAATVPAARFSCVVLGLLKGGEGVDDGGYQALANSVIDTVFGSEPSWPPHVLSRLRALLYVMQHAELQAFVFTRGDHLFVHPALVRAAAELKVSRSGHFPRKRLVALAGELRDREYPDFQWGKL